MDWDLCSYMFSMLFSHCSPFFSLSSMSAVGSINLASHFVSSKLSSTIFKITVSGMKSSAPAVPST